MADANGSVYYRGLRAEAVRHCIWVGPVKLPVRPAYCKLLAALLDRPKWVVTYEQLYAALGHEFPLEGSKRTLHAHFSRLGGILMEVVY